MNTVEPRPSGAESKKQAQLHATETHLTALSSQLYYLMHPEEHARDLEPFISHSRIDDDMDYKLWLESAIPERFKSLTKTTAKGLFGVGFTSLDQARKDEVFDFCATRYEDSSMLLNMSESTVNPFRIPGLKTQVVRMWAPGKEAVAEAKAEIVTLLKNALAE